MVGQVQVKLGREGKPTKWDENLNVKTSFGEYATLVDGCGKQIPLKSSGEPANPLNLKEVYTVQLHSGKKGRNVEDVIREAKMKYFQKSRKKRIELEMTKQKSSIPNSDSEEQLGEAAESSLLLNETEKKETTKAETRQKKKKSAHADPDTNSSDETHGCFCWPWGGKKKNQKIAKKLSRASKGKSRRRSKKSPSSYNSGNAEVDRILEETLGSI
jgi:hypothetical protein